MATCKWPYQSLQEALTTTNAEATSMNSTDYKRQREADEKKLATLMTALRLWYKTPWIQLPYEVTKELFLIVPEERRVASRKPLNFPTCLCKTCGALQSNFISGYAWPLRETCGQDSKPSQVIAVSKENLKVTNTYQLDSLAMLIHFHPLDYYQGEQLEAFKSMNPTYLSTGKQI